MTDEKRTQFDYLLNAVLHAAQADKPAEHGYRDKTIALFAYVRDLERKCEAPSDDIEAFKVAMQRLSHDDYPGGNLWQITSVREKTLMLKAWKAARGMRVDDGPFTTADTHELARRVLAGETLQWQGPGDQWLTPRDRETMLRVLREDPTRTYRLLPAGVKGLDE